MNAQRNQNSKFSFKKRGFKTLLIGDTLNLLKKCNKTLSIFGFIVVKIENKIFKILNQRI